MALGLTDRLMEKFIRSLVTACLAMAGGSAHAVTIWPLGDSLTSGFNVPGAYRPQLHADLTAAGWSVDFVGTATNDATPYLTTRGETHHDGHSGWFIADAAGSSIDNGRGLYDSVGGWVSVIGQPDIILLMVGTNDLNRNNLVATAPARFDLLLSRLASLAPAARIIVGSVPGASETNIYKDASVTALNASIDTFNASLASIVSSQAGSGVNVELLDVNAAMTLADLASDGLHFTQAGYNKLGGLWAEAILVPEPETMTLALFGVLAVMRRRRA